jgi:hypothetical protein
METQTSKAVKLFRNGKICEALKIFSTFRIGFSKEEKRAIEIAYESMTGSEAFYRSLGIDVDEEYRVAIVVINQKYNAKK